MNETHTQHRYRYGFKRHIPIDDLQDTLTLAVLTVESLHGRSRVRLDGRWRLDRQRRTLEIDGSTELGQNLASVFTGLVSREFGDRAFHMLRAKSRPSNGARR